MVGRQDVSRRRMMMRRGFYVIYNDFIRVRLKMTTASIQDENVLMRFEAVSGLDGRRNDVIYARRRHVSSSLSRVVFFGGDVQDYTEKMQAHRDNFRHVDWNLEATAQRLLTSFGQQQHEVLVIRPSRMFLSTFSCYDNFVQSSQNGAPTHTPCHGAIEHLMSLMDNVQELLRTSELSTAPALTWILIGFSKGCVVLNQIIHEIHHGRRDIVVQNFLEQVRNMFWLDGGHAGGSNVWITDMKVLKTLVETGVRVHVHVTPYQIEDKNRPWIRREEKLFSEGLRRLGAVNLERTVHFDGQPSSIDMHFKLLDEFRKPTTIEQTL